MRLRTKGEQKAYLDGYEMCAECIEKYLSAEGKKKLGCLLSAVRNAVEIEDISAFSENKGDLISRQAVLDELEKWDWQELYLPIHFKQILDDIPSVENKGEWIPKERPTECSVDIDIVCSECGYVGIEGYAHGYELNELPVQEMKDYIKKFDMNYCTCCGAKMDKGDI